MGWEKEKGRWIKGELGFECERDGGGRETTTNQKRRGDESETGR